MDVPGAGDCSVTVTVGSVSMMVTGGAARVSVMADALGCGLADGSAVSVRFVVSGPAAKTITAAISMHMSTTAVAMTTTSRQAIPWESEVVDASGESASDFSRSSDQAVCAARSAAETTSVSAKAGGPTVVSSGFIAASHEC